MREFPCSSLKFLGQSFIHISITLNNSKLFSVASFFTICSYRSHNQSGSFVSSTMYSSPVPFLNFPEVIWSAISVTVSSSWIFFFLFMDLVYVYFSFPAKFKSNIGK
eukprot:TRINITY_DN15892_c2_g1_i1.p1 TRINITY_DN15892_c2_g1~~TRINITY_DN15892_c2_g1_i1.p1  ORF type:complete len:107 (-),score=7.42 TRINITY_DN15892_c2_g1_i1:679-999(-)